MLATVDYRGITPASHDPFLLEAYLQQLAGRPFLQFRLTYGDELTIHFGEPQAYASPKLKHLVKGAYILGTRASKWYVTPSAPSAVVIGTQDAGVNDAAGVTPLSKTELETARLLQPGAAVRSIHRLCVGDPTAPNAFGLAIELSDGASLRVFPTAHDHADAARETVADWELFTPYDRHLSVGPGPTWSYLPASQTTPAESA